MAQEYKYLVVSWKAMLQMVINLCGKGYYYYHLTELPVNKEDKWDEIDKKLIGKYKSNKSKWQRQRAKAKGVANFYYLRWEHLVLILHTEGKILKEITYDDKFKDFRYSPLFLTISELITLRIQHLDKVEVTLAKSTYKGFKDSLYNTVKTQDDKEIKKEFNLLNGLPSYSGIHRQKIQLAEFVVRKAKEHGVKTSSIKGGKCNLTIKHLRFNTRKKTVKNFN
ncbi:hypothetical protein GLW00_00130 [Halobacillus litoralis]|uniref:Uncharacterized protein n=1 Tax=Halobacillus litoralis TaxID=45668 RepID=A0A845F646_9BACI|nr:hypothetical protein [Halobacillus litoralis]MYL69236.1 hypothetical protein [Halobacillus litoralis]